MEATNKALGTRIRASTAVADAIDFKGRLTGDLLLRERSEPLRAYEPLDAAELDAPLAKLYQEAFSKLGADAAAMPAFVALVGAHANDRLAGFHLKRLVNGANVCRIRIE